MNVAAYLQRINSMRKQILQRYASLHAFCNAHPELTRSAVYMTIKGTYAGNVERQLALIEAALSGAHCAKVEVRYMSVEQVTSALQEYKCLQCSLGVRDCVECQRQTKQETETIHTLIYGVMPCQRA